MTPALGFITMPTDPEKRKNMFEVDEKTRADVLNYFMDVLLLPYKLVWVFTEDLAVTVTVGFDLIMINLKFLTPFLYMYFITCMHL